MYIISMLFIGLLVGAAAKLIMPKDDPGGFWVTILLGIAGSMTATFLGRMLGVYGNNDAAGFLMSIGGAVLLLAAYRFLRKRGSRAL